VQKDAQEGQQLAKKLGALIAKARPERNTDLADMKNISAKFASIK
jgi:hypothetical protein